MPVQVPSTIFLTYVSLICSEPRSSSASTAPAVSIGQRENDKFADFHISMTGVETVLGRPCPPYSAGAWSAFQPPATNCL